MLSTDMSALARDGADVGPDEIGLFAEGLAGDALCIEPHGARDEEKALRLLHFHRMHIVAARRVDALRWVANDHLHLFPPDCVHEKSADSRPPISSSDRVLLERFHDCFGA